MYVLEGDVKGAFLLVAVIFSGFVLSGIISEGYLEYGLI